MRLATLAMIAIAVPAHAGQCPPDKVAADARTSGPAETSAGSKVTPLIATPLGQGIEGRLLRLRRLEVAPGAQVGWHVHDNRSVVVYLVEGVFTEYRGDCAAPIDHQAGEAIAETLTTKHYWRNNGSVPVVAIVSDITTPDAAESRAIVPQ